MAKNIKLKKMRFAWRKNINRALGIALCFFPVVLVAQDVGLAGLMGTKAMLMINGNQPQAVRIGETLNGVKLISIQGDAAVIEVGGKKRSLRVGQHAIGSRETNDGSGIVKIPVDPQGHFFVQGTVNSASIRFMVDTGATSIVLGAADAKRIGIDPKQGKPIMTQTANGQAQASRVQLDTVKIGDITMRYVDAVILNHDMPTALLGMSFLSRTEMKHEGDAMTLKKRF